MSRMEDILAYGVLLLVGILFLAGFLMTFHTDNPAWLLISVLALIFLGAG